MRFQGQMLSIALVAASLMASAAHAAEAWEDCALFRTDAATAVQAVQSCSDAFFVRRNVSEADALCSGAHELSGRAMKKFQALESDPADKERKACATEHRSAVRGLIGALDWLIAYSGFRLDGEPSAPPKPFAG